MTHRHPQFEPAASHAVHRQRGSVLIQFALFLGVMVAILGVVDIGYMYYAKRDLQRVADLAALEAVQAIDLTQSNDASACVAAGATSVSIGKNWPASLTPVTQDVHCGGWSAEYPAPRHFDRNVTPINAAHVMLEGQSPRLLPFNWDRTIQAEAIAKRGEEMAAFQVGSQLLNFNNDAVLGRLLGLVGLDVTQLSVLDADGLANAKITPSGLLKALGIDLGIGGLAALSPDQVLKLDNLTLLHVLNASVEAVSDSTAKASLRAIIDVLQDAKIDSVKLLDLKTPLLDREGVPGLLAFLSLGSDQSPNDAALDLQLGVGDVLKTAIMVGANGHAVHIPTLNVLNLVTAGVTVVEPPKIAIGPVGTKANSAQVRLNLDIDSAKLPLFGPLLNMLNLRVNLPIKVDAVRADATLDDIHCPDPARDNQPSIDVGVKSRLAGITIGHTDKSSSDPENLLIKTPLGGLGVRGPIVAGLLQDEDEIESLLKDESDWTRENRLFLGDTVDAVLDAVFNLLGGIFSPPMLSPEWGGMVLEGSVQDARNAQIEMLAELYLEATKKNGFYNVQDATELILKGRGVAGEDGGLSALVSGNFSFNNAIPVSCLVAICPVSTWESGTFSEAFHAYTSVPYSILDLVGIPTLGNGYTSCSGLLTSLLAWNACVSSNLKNLLKKHDNQVALTDSSQLVKSLKDPSTDNVTCSGTLCVLLQPLLKPVKTVLNALGSALLSPLLTNVLGLNLGQSEVKALDIQCNASQLVY